MDKLNENENNNVISQKHSGNRFLGILGSILGGFIAAIPWILIYIYGNMISSALAFFITVSALKGYQIFKGPIDKKLPFIIAITSILVVIITQLVIIPFLLLINEGYPATPEAFNLLYDSKDFVSAISHDLIISVLFTLLGIIGVISNINKQLKSEDTPNKITISGTSSPDNTAYTPEELSKVKDIFNRYNAIDKEHAMDKNTLFQELEELENKNNLFFSLLSQQIIRKHKGKFYFSEIDAQNPNPHAKNKNIKSFIFILLFAFLLAVIIFSSNKDSNNSNTLPNNSINNQISRDYTIDEFNMKVTIPEDMTIVTGGNLDYVFGSGASDIYEFGAYNQDNMISCFIQEVPSNDLEAYKKSLKDYFLNSEYTVLKDFENKQISNIDFSIIEFNATIDNTPYNDLCMIHSNNGKVVFIEYSYPSVNSEEIKSDLEQLITKIK